jgi:hypothetical protein
MPDRQRRRGKPDMTGEEWQARVTRWVEDSCAEQGVPAKITEPATVRYIASLFGVRDAHQRPIQPPR